MRANGASLTTIGCAVASELCQTNRRVATLRRRRENDKISEAITNVRATALAVWYVLGAHRGRSARTRCRPIVGHHADRRRRHRPMRQLGSHAEGLSFRCRYPLELCRCLPVQSCGSYCILMITHRESGWRTCSSTLAQHSLSKHYVVFLST